MRYSSKSELLSDIERQHAAFEDLVDSLPRTRLREPGVWGDDWSVHDLIAHLTEWEQMLLGWHREGLEGRTPAMPAPGYTWRQTPDLNRAIQKKHRRKSSKRVREAFDASYQETLEFAKGLSEDAIFTPGQFAWTGKNALAAYLGANTASHYRTATKIIRRWLRRTAGGAPPARSTRG